MRHIGWGSIYSHSPSYLKLVDLPDLSFADGGKAEFLKQHEYEENEKDATDETFFKAFTGFVSEYLNNYRPSTNGIIVSGSTSGSYFSNYKYEKLDLNSKTIANSQICQGDSGGPVYIEDKKRKKLVQIGIIVFTDGNCNRNVNGYLLLEEYQEWMRDKLDEKLFEEIEWV